MVTDDAAVYTSIAHGLDLWYARLGRQFGPLSRPQRRMLAAVASAASAIRVGDLAAELGLSMPGTTRMIDSLEALGYLRRTRAVGADQRQVHVALTPEGRSALSDADRVFAERVKVTLTQLDRADRAMLAQLLTRLATDEPHDDGSLPG